MPKRLYPQKSKVKVVKNKEENLVISNNLNANNGVFKWISITLTTIAIFSLVLSAYKSFYKIPLIDQKISIYNDSLDSFKNRLDYHWFTEVSRDVVYATKNILTLEKKNHPAYTKSGDSLIDMATYKMTEFKRDEIKQLIELIPGEKQIDLYDKELNLDKYFQYIFTKVSNKRFELISKIKEQNKNKTKNLSLSVLFQIIGIFLSQIVVVLQVLIKDKKN